MSGRKILEMSLIDFLVRSKWGRPRYVYPLIFFIGLFLMWLGAHSFPCFKTDRYSFSLICSLASGTFIKEIGVAFAIAALVGSTVEAYNLRRHDIEAEEMSRRFFELGEQITEEVAINAVRHGALTFFPALSSTIIGATQRQVLQAQITRENYQIHIGIEKIDEKKCLLVMINIQYKLRNDTNSAIPYEFAFGFEPELQGGLDRETTPHFLKISSEEFNGIIEMERDGVVHRSGERITKLFKKTVVPAKSVVDVEVEFTEQRMLDDCLYWVMTIPSDRLSLELQPCVGLEYAVDSLHPFDAEGPQSTTRRVTPFRHTKAKTKTKTWEIQKGLLPGQGILLRWHCN